MASGNIYFDVGGSSTRASGTTDSATPTISGANGCSVTGTTVTLPAGTVLTSVNADGSQAIFIADATNTNIRIFWISLTSGSGGATPTLTVSPAPLGTITTSAWAIGGWITFTNLTRDWVSGAVRPGDTVIFNNTPGPQSSSAFFSVRVAGTAAGGPITIKGKAGVRPRLINNTTSSVISGAFAHVNIENLECMATGATGAGITGNAGWEIKNVLVSQAGGIGISTGSANKIINCEVMNCGGDGINSTTTAYISGCYIHDNLGDGIELTNANQSGGVWNSIISHNGGRGLYLSSVGSAEQYTGDFRAEGNTIYGNRDSGLEVADGDSMIHFNNNIIANNGYIPGSSSGAGKYNLDWPTAVAETYSNHSYNIFYSSAAVIATGAANLSNAVAQPTDLTTDPLLTLPDGTAIAIASADTTTEIITTSASHGLNQGDLVKAQNGSGTLPAGITDGNTYWVDVQSGTTCTLHATLDAAINSTLQVNITATGTGELRKLSTRNFLPQLTSPAKASAYTTAFPTGQLNYLDRGAIQRQEPVAGGTSSPVALINGGLVR